MKLCELAIVVLTGMTAAACAHQPGDKLASSEAACSTRAGVADGRNRALCLTRSEWTRYDAGLLGFEQKVRNDRYAPQDAPYGPPVVMPDED